MRLDNFCWTFTHMLKAGKTLWNSWLAMNLPTKSRTVLFQAFNYIHGGWNWMIFKVLSSPNHSRIPQFYDIKTLQHLRKVFVGRLYHWGNARLNNFPISLVKHVSIHKTLIPKGLSNSLSSYLEKCVYWANKTQRREFKSHSLLMS